MILVLYTLYTLFCIFDYLISNEFIIANTPEYDFIGGETNYSVVNTSPSFEGKNHVYLSSSNDPSSSTNPQTPVTNPQIPIRISTPDGGTQSPIFSANPKPPLEVPIPVHGQGDHPTFFTTANDGDKLNSYNTFNMAEGKVTFCESTNKDHVWNTRNVWNLDKNNGPCYNCKTEIDTSHYKCEKCYRQLCNSCNSVNNYHATQNFYSRMTPFKRY